MFVNVHQVEMKLVSIVILVAVFAQFGSPFVVEFLERAGQKGFFKHLPEFLKRPLVADCRSEDLEDLKESDLSYQICMTDLMEDVSASQAEPVEKSVSLLCSKIVEVDRCLKYLINTDISDASCSTGVNLYRSVLLGELELLCQDEGKLLIEFLNDGLDCWEQNVPELQNCLQVITPMIGSPPFNPKSCKVWDVSVQCLSRQVKSCPQATWSFLEKTTDRATKEICNLERNGTIGLNAILEIMEVHYISEESMKFAQDYGIGTIYSIQESFASLTNCLMGQTIMSILQSSQTSEIVPRLCTNLPHHQDCIFSFISSLKSLTDQHGVNDLGVIQQAIFEAIELMCNNGGERLTDAQSLKKLENMINLGMAGVDCFISNRKKIDTCHQMFSNPADKSNGSPSTSIFTPQRCQMEWNGIDCMLNALKTCPTTSMAELFKDVFDAFWYRIPCKFSSVDRSPKFTASIDGIADALVKMIIDSIIPPMIQDTFDGRCADEFEVDRVETLKKARSRFKNCVRFEISRVFDTFITTTEDTIASLCNKVNEFERCLNPLVSAMKNCTNRIAARDIEIGKSAVLHGLVFACENGGQRLLEFGNHPSRCGVHAKRRAKLCSRRYSSSIVDDWEQNSIYGPDHCENHIHLMRCSTDLMTRCLGELPARNLEEIFHVMIESTPCGGIL